MSRMILVTGVKKVIRNMLRGNALFGEKIERGLKKGGLLLQRWSQEIVPVDTSALKGSAGTEATGKGFKTEVAVFYTMNYAVYVHERTELRHKPGKFAKYLEKPLRENRNQLLKVMAGE